MRQPESIKSHLNNNNEELKVFECNDVAYFYIITLLFVVLFSYSYIQNKLSVHSLWKNSYTLVSEWAICHS